ncbi:recombinase family protein [Dankookia sp. P2]|uniref:recombinase family protein n=1 Tax=Dankookia sp. P2 TaxID=3423955 RepID=UPI003D67A94D
MALSDTARRILADAAQHPLRFAVPPDKLPIAATRAVLNNLLKQSYVEERAASEEFGGLRCHQRDGARPTVRITKAGMAATGAAQADTAAEKAVEQVAPGTVPAQEAGSSSLAPPAAPESLATPDSAGAAQRPSARPSLRNAAHRVLAAWDDHAGEYAEITSAIAALRAMLAKPAPAPRPTGQRKPREGTKQQQVLGMLRRPEGATVAQIAEYQDVASGKDDRRPGFQAALARCRQLGAVLLAARLDRITRRAHTLSWLLEEGYQIRAADMPGADDLMMRIYAAMAQKERELISERTRAALAAAKARGAVPGGDRSYRPVEGPSAAAAARARRVAAERVAHRLALKVERLRAEGVTGQAAIARALTERGVPTPRGSGAWTHTTVTRALARAAL